MKITKYILKNTKLTENSLSQISIFQCFTKKFASFIYLLILILTIMEFSDFSKSNDNNLKYRSFNSIMKNNAVIMKNFKGLNFSNCADSKAIRKLFRAYIQDKRKEILPLKTDETKKKQLFSELSVIIENPEIVFDWLEK